MQDMAVKEVDQVDEERNGMSQRGFANVESILPKIRAQVAERTKTSDFKIDLSTAENCLLRPEVMEIYKAAVNVALESKHLSYPKGFAGDPLLLSTLATFFNAYFNPFIPVQPAHIVTAPGAATCLDTLLFNLCDPDDAVLVPGPYWNGFDFQFRVRSTVEPIVVNVDSMAKTFTMSLLPALSNALTASKRPVRALVLTNPHNPYGQCYPREVLEQCIMFCQEHKIHYISDEVYALSSFPSADGQIAVPFVSALSINVHSLDYDPQYVHTIWSTSKDFGSSGIRMGCIVTQNNTALAVGTALAANTQISSLSSIATIGLLTSPMLPSLLSLNVDRLRTAYGKITSFLSLHNIDFIPVTAGLFIFAQLDHLAETWEDEARTIVKIRDAGVLVSPGKAYHGMEKGWARITFAVDPEELQKALDILGTVLPLRPRAKSPVFDTVNVKLEY